MSNFTPGNGSGDLQSTTLPAAFLELAYKLQAAEKANTTEDAPENIQITLDSNAGVATVSASLPITRTVNDQGQIVETAVDYLNIAFNNGGGQLNSTSLPAAFLELTQIIVAAENAREASQTGLDIDANVNIVTISSPVPFTETLSNGKPTIVATDYLV